MTISQRSSDHHRNHLLLLSLLLSLLLQPFSCPCRQSELHCDTEDNTGTVLGMSISQWSSDHQWTDLLLLSFAVPALVMSVQAVRTTP